MRGDYMLFCRVESVERGEAVISVRQHDLTPVYGVVPLNFLEFYPHDPRFNLIPVRVQKESLDAALIQWDARCACGPENCPGDAFWVKRDQIFQNV